MSESKFQMSINLQVLNHLGLNLYSNTSAVLSEIVANAWDADATRVEISIDGDTITIIDNGIGMNLSDMFLLLRQLNNRIQSSLYFVRAGWSKYAFTWSGSPDNRPIKAEVLSSNSWMSWTMAWEPMVCFRSLLRYSSGLYSGE